MPAAAGHAHSSSPTEPGEVSYQQELQTRPRRSGASGVSSAVALGAASPAGKHAPGINKAPAPGLGGAKGRRGEGHRLHGLARVVEAALSGGKENLGA